MLLKKHPEVQPVVAEYQRISWSEKRRKIADYKEKIRRDEWARTEYVRDEGREQGRTEGREESRKALEEMARENEELRRKLREAGIK